MICIHRALALLALPAALCSQVAPIARVTVRVTDTSSAPIQGVDVSVVRDVAVVLAHATTSADGRATLNVSRVANTLQFVARRIGYQAGYRFFAIPAASDSISIDIRLLPSAQQLAPVTVTAEEDIKRKNYHLDADDIAQSKRAIVDGIDVFKLRPDMKNSHGGQDACKCWACPPNPRFPPRDGWIESVWINGSRVSLVPTDDPVTLAGLRARAGTPQSEEGSTRPIRGLRQTGGVNLPSSQHPHIDTVLSILKTIHAEHVLEVNYHDCFDASLQRGGGDMAMFISLKPGIGFKPGLGTYVIAQDTAAKRPGFAVDSLARHRFRLLGAYDESSGDPVAGVVVTDTLSGLSARTTATGTVSLFFLPEGTRVIRLHHDGFRDTTFVVTISPSDTLPVTMILSRTK